MRSQFRYSPPLDGIRAIAIFGVFIFHVYPAALRGGFTGVDVFFVLSGFLIASIILHDIREGDFSLREFYFRRIQRLLPNSVVTVLAALLLWRLFLPPSFSRLVGRHALWTLANLSNFFIWKNFGGYWGDAAGRAPLLHTWSLAVEEQFYMLFPTSMVLLARFQRNRVTHWLLAAAALSLGLCVYVTPHHTEAAFYLLPTRVWELLLGAVLASYRTPLRDDAPPLRQNLLLQESAGWVGFLLILAGFIAIDDSRGFPGAVALIPTVGTLLVLISVTAETRVSRLLSRPLLVGTGKLSYSLYLWHWPLITLGKTLAELREMPAVAGAAASAVASVLLAWASYVSVEQPLRRRGPGRGWRLAGIAAGFCLVALTAGWFAARNPKMDTTRYFDQTEFYFTLYSAGKTEPMKQVIGALRFQDVRFPDMDSRVDDTWRSGGIIHPYGKGTPTVVVLGSSHALMYARLIDSICERARLSVAFLCVDGTPVFFSGTVNPSFPDTREAREFDDSRRKWLRTWRPQAVFVIDRWDARVENAGFDGEFRSFLREVSPLTNRVLFVAQVPVLAMRGSGGDELAGANLRELMSWRMGDSGLLPRLFPDGGETARRRAVAAAEAATAAVSNLRVLRPDLAFHQSDGSVLWAAGRTAYYCDDNHLSDAGAEILRGMFQGAIQEATSGVPVSRPLMAGGQSK
jgi:peptidoglycan/LPS O-acetylase OafA/YrhL